MNQEIFREIPFYKGFAVSNFGRVWNIKEDCIVLPDVNHRGELQVVMPKRWSQQREFISRLVALMWIPNPKHWPEVIHIDGNKFNNSVENLRWQAHAPDWKRRD